METDLCENLCKWQSRPWRRRYKRMTVPPHQRCGKDCKTGWWSSGLSRHLPGVCGSDPCRNRGSQDQLPKHRTSRSGYYWCGKNPVLDAIQGECVGLPCGEQSFWNLQSVYHAGIWRLVFCQSWQAYRMCISQWSCSLWSWKCRGMHQSWGLWVQLGSGRVYL